MDKTCAKCGGELHREECDSIGMQMLGMYWLVCENGCPDPVNAREGSSDNAREGSSDDR